MLVLLLALAVFVALHPLPDPGQSPTGRSAPAPDRPADLNRLRAQAALQPAPAPGSAAPRGPLAGVVLPCLGAPGTVDLGVALAGRPALLNLWGPLCQPCAEELPALAAYAAEPGAVPVLGVEVQRLPDGALD